jgi:hypothetical protein
VTSEEPSVLAARNLRSGFSKFLVTGRLGASEPLSELAELAFETARRSTGSRRVLAYVLGNMLSAISVFVTGRHVDGNSEVESKIVDPIEGAIDFLCEGGDDNEALRLAEDLIEAQIDIQE